MALNNKKIRYALLTLVLATVPSMVGASDNSPSGKKICPENKGTDLVFPKENKFRVVKYDASTRVYTIESAKFPGEGPSLITVEALIANVNEIRADQDRILLNPKSIVQKVFTNDRDLPTLFPEERDARKGCVPAR